MIEILSEVVARVGRYQRQAFSDSALVFETKADRYDFVSEVDLRSQQMILNAIDHHFPASGIVAEENGQDKQSHDGTWFLVDPLDGTANYKAGIPIWAVSIGFIKDGEVNSGIIALPFSEEIYFNTSFSPPQNQLQQLVDAQFYGIDSAFENLRLDGFTLKRRQLGAAIPTLLWCCDSRHRQRSRLDFALMGKGAFWDVCGAIAFFKHLGGALIDATGIDFTECRDVFQALGGIEKLRSYNFRYVASVSKPLARDIYRRYLQH